MSRWMSILKGIDVMTQLQDMEFDHPNSPDIQRGMFLVNYFEENESEIRDFLEDEIKLGRKSNLALDDSLRQAMEKVLANIPNSQSVDRMILFGQLRLDEIKGFSEHEHRIPDAIIGVMRMMDKEFAEQERDAN